MKSVYQAIARSLENMQPVILATVVESHGSTPRKAGACMALLKDGSSVGSVGGGGVEAAVERSAQAVWSRGGALLKAFDFDVHGAADAGMICGGNQRIMMRLIAPGAARQLLFHTLAGPGVDGAPQFMVTCLDGQGPHFPGIDLGLMDADGKSSGISLDPEIQAQLRRELHSPVFPILKHLDGRTYLLEKLASPGTVFIFGAGHVARPTLALAAQVGFKTVVLDDRPEFATAEYFPHSDQIILFDSFTHALADVTVGDDAYLIIVTRGHHHDQTVLEQALATPAAYIGMMGSQKKIRACFDNLEKRGWQKADLARVHSPIGLDIGSETPEEIAVSIVAELIAVRARLQGKKFR